MLKTVRFVCYFGERCRLDAAHAAFERGRAAPTLDPHAAAQLGGQRIGGQELRNDLLLSPSGLAPA